MQIRGAPTIEAKPVASVNIYLSDSGTAGRAIMNIPKVRPARGATRATSSGFMYVLIGILRAPCVRSFEDSP